MCDLTVHILKVDVMQFEYQALVWSIGPRPRAVADSVIADPPPLPVPAGLQYPCRELQMVPTTFQPP